MKQGRSPRKYLPLGSITKHGGVKINFHPHPNSNTKYPLTIRPMLLWLRAPFIELHRRWVNTPVTLPAVFGSLNIIDVFADLALPTFRSVARKFTKNIEQSLSIYHVYGSPPLYLRSGAE